MKDLAKLRQRQILITEKLEQLDIRVETFLLRDQDRRPESHWCLGSRFRLRCVLCWGTDTFLSPLGNRRTR